jgi:uncharacterized protein (TIGR00251 family)
MKPVAARIDVHVKPGASRDCVEGWRQGALVVRLSAPPVEGAANKALVKLLSGKAGVAKGKIQIVSGEKGRAKVLLFEGITIEELKERFG